VSQHYETFLYGELKLNQSKFNMEFIDTTENLFSKKFGNPTFILAYACVQYKRKPNRDYLLQRKQKETTRICIEICPSPSQK